ncbi:hypothetical protein [Litchfieldia alkalitelluris]|nr:hypothetical protein [Litchfieldia alkalitelluris]
MKKSGWERDIRMQSFSWKEEGLPHFGSTISTEEGIVVPSGE